MCGITGFWGSGWRDDNIAHRDITRITAALNHRGPDGQGVWLGRQEGLALGHRRLSILDLSPAGSQPMQSISGRYILTFNGEIYNHRQLRRELESKAAAYWRGHSDTETLVAAIDTFGLERALRAVDGMFAVAVWDRERRTLSLARDRIGEKPLYYGWSDNVLVFGSELKALLAFPNFPRDIDMSAVSTFLRFSYVPHPRSIFLSVRKLPPGSLATFSDPAADPIVQKYWSISEAIEKGSALRMEAPYSEILAELETCLLDVVSSQMLSDVPIGCFLSGGIDSSLIASLMQRAGTSPARTFSIGFASRGFDEASAARLVAEHLGTRHTELTVTESEALGVIPDLSQVYDEPFADSSQIPTLILSRLARKEVKVALTGDGGDEMFCGYNRHLRLPSAWRRLKFMPAALRSCLGRAAGCLEFLPSRPYLLNEVAARIGLAPATMRRIGHFGSAVATSNNFEELYGSIASVYLDASNLIAEGYEAGNEHLESEVFPEGLDPQAWLMAMDAATYLPGDVLVKVDRAAMSASLETRAPFLDRRVVEMSFRLPPSARSFRGVGKRALRDILFRHVPRQLVDRPKQGFSVPLAEWLRGELRPWAESLINPHCIQKHGCLNERAVTCLWGAFLDGHLSYGPIVWNIVTLQDWLETWSTERLQREA